MTAAEPSAITTCAVFWSGVKSFILEPKEAPSAPRRSSSTASFYSVEDDDNRKPVQYDPATCTGVRELPSKTALVIMLLWLPRFFVPWIAAWHNYDVRFLANVDLVDVHERELFIQEVILFCGKCGITMFISFLAGVLNTERSTYVLWLILYTLSPVAGGYVNTVLRSRLIDGDLYSDWFTYIALMRWAMAIPFIFFPVQLSSIYYEKENMSRQAHYNWVSFYAFFEFLNAYIAFWIAPGQCPTTEWTQTAIWIGIGSALYTVTLLTIVFFFNGRGMTKELAYCFNSCVYREDEPDGTGSSWSIVLMMTACYLCIFIPVIYTSFVFAVLQRHIRDENWDGANAMSATGLFYLGRAFGVAVMIVLLTTVRKYGRKITRIRLLRADVLALGLPHVFTTIALLVLFSGSTTLPRLNEGDVIMGPAPDKTVMIFFNLIYRNRTVCVSSEHFRPLKIRPFHHATQTLDNSSIERTTITVTPEPDSIPSIATNYEMKNFSHGEWHAFAITLANAVAPEDDAETKLKNYYTEPTVTKLEMNKTFAKELPQVLIFNSYLQESNSLSYQIQSNSSGNPDITITANGEGITQLWKVRPPGNWSIRMNNGSVPAPWYDFTIDDTYSVYFLANYLSAPIKPKQTGGSAGSHRPTWFKLFKIAEVAGPDGKPPEHHFGLPRSKAVQTGLILVGMAAGGVYVGVVYMFWIEPFISTTMRFAIIWVLSAVADEVPKIKLIDIDPVVSSLMSDLQIIFTVLHFAGALLLYRPEFNRRMRPD